MQRDIHHKCFFPHPPEQIWDCLTKPELLDQWFMKSNFRPEKGYKFEFRHKPKPAMGWNGIVYCEVLEVIPMRLLSFSWKGGPEEGVVTLDSIVTWTLTPRDNGTELTLAHTGFRGFKNYVSSLVMDKGWKHIMVRKLGGVLKEYAYGLT